MIPGLLEGSPIFNITQRILLRRLLFPDYFSIPCDTMLLARNVFIGQSGVVTLFMIIKALISNTSLKVSENDVKFQ